MKRQNGFSLRQLGEYELGAKAEIVPNPALFGRPVATGRISVECVNRFVLTGIMSGGGFGPWVY